MAELRDKQQTATVCAIFEPKAGHFASRVCGSVILIVSYKSSTHLSFSLILRYNALAFVVKLKHAPRSTIIIFIVLVQMSNDSILAIIPGVGFEVLMLDSGFCGVSGMCLDGSGIALMA